MTITKEDLDIDDKLTVESAPALGFNHELDVLIDPAHPEWGLNELVKFSKQGHKFGQPSEGKDERFVGVYEANPPGDDDQPVDLLDDEADIGSDDN
jgi:hypothetical protein